MQRKKVRYQLIISAAAIAHRWKTLTIDERKKIKEEYKIIRRAVCSGKRGSCTYLLRILVFVEIVASHPPRIEFVGCNLGFIHKPHTWRATSPHWRRLSPSRDDFFRGNPIKLRNYISRKVVKFPSVARSCDSQAADIGCTLSASCLPCRCPLNMSSNYRFPLFVNRRSVVPRSIGRFPREFPTPP